MYPTGSQLSVNVYPAIDQAARDCVATAMQMLRNPTHGISVCLSYLYEATEKLADDAEKFLLSLQLTFR